VKERPLGATSSDLENRAPDFAAVEAPQDAPSQSEPELAKLASGVNDQKLQEVHGAVGGPAPAVGATIDPAQLSLQGAAASASAATQAPQSSSPPSIPARLSEPSLLAPHFCSDLQTSVYITCDYVTSRQVKLFRDLPEKRATHLIVCKDNTDISLDIVSLPLSCEDTVDTGPRQPVGSPPLHLKVRKTEHQKWRGHLN